VATVIDPTAMPTHTAILATCVWASPSSQRR